MDSQTPAFALSLTATHPRTRHTTLTCTCLRSSTFTTISTHTIRPFTKPTRSNLPRMEAAEPETPSTPEAPTPQPPSEVPSTDSTTSATEILETLRAESAADDTPSERSMLGVYRDVDGKSNVWAVEPEEKTDTGPQISKTTIIVAAAAFIVVALLVLPLLPFTNPDQI